MRVSSFTAFSSIPLYEVEGGERRLHQPSRERRKANRETSEWKNLKTHFASILMKRVLRSHEHGEDQIV